jgi:manganese transport protein
VATVDAEGAALIIIAVRANPAQALVLSQVVLSFGIPFALVNMAMLTCPRDVMGAQANRRLTTILAWSCVVMIGGMNIF